MKKIIAYFFSAIMLLSITSCKDDDKYLFGESPDARLQAKLTEYQDLLCNAPCGWLVAVGTQATGTNGGAYRMWMKFTKDNRVTMYSDQNATTAVTPKTSSYRMKAMQVPTLMFDTYNYIHVMADPGVKIPGGTTGVGLESDFDINLIGDINGDELIAIGRFNDCPVILKKATPQDTVAITSGPALTDIKTTVAANWAPMKYPTININGFVVQMSIGSRLSTINYKDSTGAIKTDFVQTYAEFNQDIRLMEPFEYENIKFERIVWDGTKYVINVNGNNYEVSDYGQPFYPLEFGVGKTYTLLTVNKSQLNTAQGSSMVDPFLSVYDLGYTNILARPTSFTNRFYLRAFTIKFSQGTTGATMTLTIQGNDGSPTGGASSAAYVYKLNEDPDGSVYFTNFVSSAGNYNTYVNIYGQGVYDNILSYFLHSGTGTLEILNGSNPRVLTLTPSGNKFRIDWAPNNTPGLAANLGGFYVVSDSTNYVPGTVGN